MHTTNQRPGRAAREGAVTGAVTGLVIGLALSLASAAQLATGLLVALAVWVALGAGIGAVVGLALHALLRRRTDDAARTPVHAADGTSVGEVDDARTDQGRLVG